MIYFHFRENDKDLGIIDLRFVTGALLDVRNKHIIINISGTSEMVVEYEDAARCSDQFLAMTSALEVLQDETDDIVIFEIDED